MTSSTCCDRGASRASRCSRATARGAAARVAQAVGVDAVRAELLPHDKVEAVKAMRAEWGSVAMVGDGINDAPALAAADVGIVMGAIGSDAALETADVALMGDDLPKLPFALRLSRAAMRTIRANIAIALVVKVIFLVLAVSGYTSLWLAILADTGRHWSSWQTGCDCSGRRSAVDSARSRSPFFDR